MTTMTQKITLPTAKPGLLAVFTIEFDKKNFITVIDAVAELKSYKDLYDCTLWKVI